MQDDKSIDKMSPHELRAALHEARVVVTDLMQSHEELMAGIGNIVVDYALLNECRVNGDNFLRRYT